jgi:hypothetical protein
MRKTSDVERSKEGFFPYELGTIAYFVVTDGVPVPINGAESRREALERARRAEITLYAVWPGKWRSDLFLVHFDEASTETEQQPKLDKSVSQRVIWAVADNK